MGEGDPRFGQVVRAIKIYSGMEPADIRQMIDAAHGTAYYPYPTKLMTAMRYAQREFDVPYRMIEQICAANRRLTGQEIRMHRRLQQQSQKNSSASTAG